MRTRMVLAVAMLIGLTACAADSAVVVSSSDAAPAAEMATCAGEAEGFPVEVATGPAPDESVVFGNAPGAALRAFLDAGGDPGGGGFQWTGGDWLVLHRNEKFVQYGYRKADWFAYANAELKPTGWNVSNYGGCQPRVVRSSGWSIHHPVDNEASYVTITYEQRVGCGGEIVPTEADTAVTETDSEVGILLRLTPAESTTEPSSPQACVAIGVSSPVQKRVVLKSPLGARALVDYGAVPHPRAP